jgi:hypothetical protein
VSLDYGRRSSLKRAVVLCVALTAVLGFAAGASALKVADPTPSQSFSDTTGNQGYLEVASDDGSGALVRGCNENEATPGGDDTTGYIWVNPDGEETPATYGNSTIGAGDADGEDGSPPRDIDEDTNDDCVGNNNDPDPTQ